MIRKKLCVRQYNLPVKVKRNDDGFLAFCPDWKDCYAQGDSVEEVLGEVNMVASSLVDLYEEEGMGVPLKLKKSGMNVSGMSFDLPLIMGV